MKRFYAMCLLFSLCLCSCTSGSASYPPQGEIRFNYNNIHSFSGFWLTDEGACYSEDVLVIRNCYMDASGKTTIGYGFSNLQQYADGIYMTYNRDIDTENSVSQLKRYDPISKKTVDVCTLRNCWNYLVLDGNVYYLQYDWAESLKLSLMMYSLSAQEHTCVQDSVLSFGVAGDQLVYLTEKSRNVSVFQYDAEEGTSVKRGSFALDIEDMTAVRECAIASYTAEHVFFACPDDNTTLWKFTYETGETAVLNIDGFLDCFVSFDKCSYFSVYDTEKGGRVFKMINDTGEFTLLGENKSGYSLFVGSDDGVYVRNGDNTMLEYYSEQGGKKSICGF